MFLGAEQSTKHNTFKISGNKREKYIICIKIRTEEFQMNTKKNNIKD